MTLKLGKQPAAPKHSDFLFQNYTQATLPQPPSQFGFDAVVPKDEWGMLGNDRVGDCTCASANHQTMLITGAKRPGQTTHPTPVPFTTQDTLNDYSAITGYDPSDPSTDQGARIRDVLSYRRHTGMKAADGQRHQIGAYVSVTPRNTTELLQALYMLEVVTIGIQFPQSAMDQFSAGQRWTVISNSPIEGGHDVPIVGYRHGVLEVITWGRLQQMSIGFYDRYCDEAWAMISEDMLQGGTTSPRGFDMATLTADLNALWFMGRGGPR